MLDPEFSLFHSVPVGSFFFFFLSPIGVGRKSKFYHLVLLVYFSDEKARVWPELGLFSL